ncbi:MAG: DUF5777 family beta-barrel protein [Bacteroidota bacterium]
MTLFFTTTKSIAQQPDLFKETTDSSAKKQVDIVRSTFKTTRLINGHSIENVGRGILDFRISHRFGALNQGGKNFFGLDNAFTRLDLDYGITDKLMVGISRGTYEKEFTGFLKYKILRQSTGSSSNPISVSYVATAFLRTREVFDPNASDFTKQQFFYAQQFLIARKFSDYFSLQLMPTMVYYQSTPSKSDKNYQFSMGLGMRQRISKRVNITGEYYYQLNPFEGASNSLALGFDIETGGHVFQLHLTNTYGTTERTFIHETTGKWGDGDIHFGFNISRVFVIKKSKVIQ